MIERYIKDLADPYANLETKTPSLKYNHTPAAKNAILALLLLFSQSCNLPTGWWGEGGERKAKNQTYINQLQPTKPNVLEKYAANDFHIPQDRSTVPFGESAQHAMNKLGKTEEETRELFDRLADEYNQFCKTEIKKIIDNNEIDNTKLRRIILSDAYYEFIVGGKDINPFFIAYHNHKTGWNFSQNFNVQNFFNEFWYAISVPLLEYSDKFGRKVYDINLSQLDVVTPFLWHRNIPIESFPFIKYVFKEQWYPIEDSAEVSLVSTWSLYLKQWYFRPGSDFSVVDDNDPWLIWNEVRHFRLAIAKANASIFQKSTNQTVPWLDNDRPYSELEANQFGSDASDILSSWNKQRMKRLVVMEIASRIEFEEFDSTSWASLWGRITLFDYLWYNQSWGKMSTDVMRAYLEKRRPDLISYMETDSEFTSVKAEIFRNPTNQSPMYIDKLADMILYRIDLHDFADFVTTWNYVWYAIQIILEWWVRDE